MEPKKDSPQFIEFARKGFLFERYVVNHFDPAFFTLLEWRSDKSADHLHPLSSKNPDLVFCYGESRQNCFAVECKYRSYIDRELEIKDEHLDNYFSFFQKTLIPVFLVIGLNGKPDSPWKQYIVPLNELLEDRYLPFERLGMYERSSGRTKFYWDEILRILK
jgi:hypothetical protein